MPPFNPRPPAEPEIGETYARLTVTAVDDDRQPYNKVYVWVQCSCGNSLRIQYTRFKQQKIQSCGCYVGEALQARQIARIGVMATLNGETHHLAEWCRRLNLKQNTVTQRMNKGMTAEEALTATPKRGRKLGGKNTPKENQK